MGYCWSSPRGRRPEGMRMWRSGSASPCQGEGREFESRHPLERSSRRSPPVRREPPTGWGGRVVRQRPAKPSTRVRIPSPPRRWAIGAAVARFPDTEEVTGSIPVSPTTQKPPATPGASSRPGSRAQPQRRVTPAGSRGSSRWASRARRSTARPVPRWKPHEVRVSVPRPAVAPLPTQGGNARRARRAALDRGPT